MIRKPCPFCRKDIPRSMQVCPYCHLDEKGEPIVMDSTLTGESGSDRSFDNDFKDLASEDPFVRDQAGIRIAQRGSGIVPTLIGILSDFAKPGLAGVAMALGKIADRRAIPVLSQAAKIGDDELRLASVWALAQYHEPDVLPILLSESQRPHAIIQSFLANVLATFQDDRVVPALAKLANHSSREVAFQAACALGEMGGQQAVLALQKVWRHGDILVRAASAASLRRLGSKPSRISPRAVLFSIVTLLVFGVGAGWLIYK